jgi:tRNA threonylcarbamoyl adenosine modification protein (Sua5/YciO/YrdC/YwlC family)
MNDQAPLIVIYLPVDDNIDRVKRAIAIFDQFECPYEIRVSSILTSPEKDVRWASGLREKGIRVILTCCGEEPQAPGMLAAASSLPLIAIPLPTPGDDEGTVALQMALRSSASAPVAVVRPNDAEQAALLALRILGSSDPVWARAVAQYKRVSMATVGAGRTKPDPSRKRELPVNPEIDDGYPVESSVIKSVREPRRDHTITIKVKGDQGKPINIELDETGRVEDAQAEDTVKTSSGRDDASRKVQSFNIIHRPGDDDTAGDILNSPSVQQPGSRQARVLGRQPIDPEVPDPDLIEESVDCLLEGGIISIPTDTVYGIAADATNPAAVQRLFEVKNRDMNRAMVILIESSKQLAGIARNLTVEVRRLTEAFWPGPLTIIFEKRPGNFDHLGSFDTIGIRMPDHSIPLALMQALGRPLACTSANISGQTEPYSADEVEGNIGGSLNAILDSGQLGQTPPSTVIDVTSEKYRVLRSGSVTIEQLAAILGEYLEIEN